MVEMRCTKWEAGLISSDTSVSLFHCDASSKLGGCWQLRLPFGNITSNRSLPFLSNFFKLPKYSAYVLLHFFL